MEGAAAFGLSGAKQILAGGRREGASRRAWVIFSLSWGEQWRGAVVCPVSAGLHKEKHSEI